MARTKKGGFTYNQRDLLIKLLPKSIENLKLVKASGRSFDDWFYGLLDDIAIENQLTVGQTQKIINILLKYYYCYFHSGINEEWNREYNWLIPHFKNLHVPLDNFMLFKLANICKKDYLKPHGKPKSCYCLIKTSNGWIRWSRLDDLNVYQKIQQAIVSNLKIGEDPLNYEMQNLWII
jgi:hypothetical protein